MSNWLVRRNYRESADEDALRGRDRLGSVDRVAIPPTDRAVLRD